MYKEIDYKQAVEFLLPKHYSGRTPNIMYAFGDFVDNELVAVCTFGKPASPTLCNGVCGKELSPNVIELNRLCRVEYYDKQLSQFVAWCLKQLKDKIVISYSDTAMNHHGYIYQACNFIYTGMTKKRTDKFSKGHSRHYDKGAKEEYRQIRSAKYRYIYICGDRRFKRNVLKHLKYPIINEYPKGDNSNYSLGDFLKPQIYKVCDCNNSEKLTSTAFWWDISYCICDCTDTECIRNTNSKFFDKVKHKLGVFTASDFSHCCCDYRGEIHAKD